jgi:hypothetical protein
VRALRIEKLKGENLSLSLSLSLACIPWGIKHETFGASKNLDILTEWFSKNNCFLQIDLK